jgi:hypothetical protein
MVGFLACAHVVDLSLTVGSLDRAYQTKDSADY